MIFHCVALPAPVHAGWLLLCPPPLFFVADAILNDAVVNSLAYPSFGSTENISQMWSCWVAGFVYLSSVSEAEYTLLGMSWALQLPP